MIKHKTEGELCPPCYTLAWRDRDPENKAMYNRWKAEHQRRQILKKQYGLSFEEYEKAVDLRGGKCDICGETAKAPEKSKTNQYIKPRNFHIDHDHSVNRKRPRGFLCVRCNSRVVPVVEHWNHLIPITQDYIERSRVAAALHP